MRTRVSVVIVAAFVAAGLAPARAADSLLDVVVVDNRGVALADVTVSGPDSSATTDVYGRAAIDAVAPVDLAISHPSLGSVDAVHRGGPARLRVTLGSPVIRALHVSGSLPGTPRWRELLDLTESTALNAVMLDLKDESGHVFATTSSAWAARAGAGLDRWDLAATIAEVHARGLRVVVRIVTFQDPVAGRAIPQLAASQGGRPFERRDQVFLDPTDPDARQYGLELAREACSAGADEVQFDYVRFPDGALAGIAFDDGSSEPVRVETIRSFLAQARAEVEPQCAVAADIFGFVTSIPGDGGIGQQLETLAGPADVLSPMVYPNHWGRGWFGFAVPADHPGPVVDQSNRNALDRVGTSAVIRPWLQDFGGYGPEQVRAQIDAADRLGLGWMLWNARSEYTVAAIPAAHGMVTPTEPAAPLHETLPASGFYDVTDSSTFAGDIGWLAASGITRGCNPPWRDEFCPRRPVSRAEAATMLVRALSLPSGPSGRFVDDDGSSHEAAIEALAAAGITRGCAPDRFCPHEPVLRDQIAAFLHRALG